MNHCSAVVAVGGQLSIAVHKQRRVAKSFEEVAAIDAKEENRLDLGKCSLETISIHADDVLGHSKTGDVSPPIHVSTTFHMSNKEDFSYTRVDNPTRRRVEFLLGALDGGFAITFSSGLAAIYAAVRTFRPKRIFMNPGYHGCRDIVENIKQFEGLQVVHINNLDPVATSGDNFPASVQPGDVIMIESPQNPNTYVFDIPAWAQKAKAAGAKLIIDSTMMPPVLLQCLKLGADMVVHSATKYLAGHSDVIMGVVVCASEEVSEIVKQNRHFTGNVPGTLETWLLLRSLRTLSLRVQRQSSNATKLAAFLHGHPALKKVLHTSLPSHPSYATAAKLFTRGHPAVICIECHTPEAAQALGPALTLFHDCTSLGAVESMIDLRVRWDPTENPLLLRVSVGIEDCNDLIADFKRVLDRFLVDYPPPKAVAKL